MTLRTVMLTLTALLFLSACNYTPTSTPTPVPSPMSATPALALGLPDDGSVCNDPNCWDQALIDGLTAQYADEITSLKSELVSPLAGLVGEVRWFIGVSGTRFDSEVTLWVRANLNYHTCIEGVKARLNPNMHPLAAGGGGGGPNPCERATAKEGFLVIEFDHAGNPLIVDLGTRDR